MKVAVLTLGCKVNKYESDALIFELKKRGYETTDSLEKADAYIINTCAVTNEAERKSRQMIERAKKFNQDAKFFVVGCASQHNAKQFTERGVNYVGGTANKKKILDQLDVLYSNIEHCAVSDLKCSEENSNSKEINDEHNVEEYNTTEGVIIEKTDVEKNNVQLADKDLSGTEKSKKDKYKIYDFPKDYEDDLFSAQTLTRAFIKIQDGCNNFCSYCIIPYIRGRSRSRSLQSILDEVSLLGEDVKEVVLVGIDVSDFKIDGQLGLGELLSRLDLFGKRLRLSSMEDGLIDEKFVKTLASLHNFCPHFHLSLQSGCDKVLQKMNRHYTTADFEKSVKLIRKYFPLAGITTDVIVGFPTETEEDFEDTMKFVEKIKFSQLHIFPYSKRDGTVADKLYKDLPGSVKSERFKRLKVLGDELKKEFIEQNKFGKVLIEQKSGEFFEGYTENYIKCFLKGNFNVGDVVEVEIIKPYKSGALARAINA